MNLRCRLERWDAKRGWSLLASYQQIDWAALDRKAAEMPESELRLTDRAGRTLAEWADGRRMPALNGAMA